MRRLIIPLLLCLWANLSQASPDAALVRQLAAEDSSDKVAAIRQLAQAADPDAARILKAMADDSLYLAGDKAVILEGDTAFDAASGAPIATPANPEAVTVNNRIRGELANALAALSLFDADRAVRLASAQKLQNNVGADMAPLLARALEKEADADIKALLVLANAQASLGSAGPAVRLAASSSMASTCRQGVS